MIGVFKVGVSLIGSFLAAGFLSKFSMSIRQIPKSLSVNNFLNSSESVESVPSPSQEMVQIQQGQTNIINF